MERPVTLAVAITAVLAVAVPAEALGRENGPAQDWYGLPVLPPMFQDAPVAQYGSSSPLAPVDVAPPAAESDFPRLMSVLDLDAWRAKDEVRSLREWAGDAFFGVPMIVPQLILEEFIPRGVAVGPLTFLYRKDSKSMPLVVFDQALFHEAEFLAQVQAQGDGLAYEDMLTRSQRNVLRRSLMAGFRATYALPSVSMDLIMETAAEQGVWAYLVAPAAAGALLYLKGVDQKLSIAGTVKGRIQLASGRDWTRAAGSADEVPVFSCEIKVRDVPLALIVCVEMSGRGLQPQFIGLGTSLDVVEDLLGREENRTRRPD